MFDWPHHMQSQKSDTNLEKGQAILGVSFSTIKDKVRAFFRIMGL